MMEKLSKLPIKIFTAILIIVLSYGLLYLLSFKPIPEKNHDVLISLISAVIGSCVTPVIGWLYTTSHATKTQQEENKSTS